MSLLNKLFVCIKTTAKIEIVKGFLCYLDYFMSSQSCLKFIKPYEEYY